MSCTDNDYCSYLNTELVKYICKEGKCVPDPSFKPTVKTVSDIENATRSDMEKISSDEKNILSDSIGEALTSISQGENPDEIKKFFQEQVLTSSLPGKKQMSKIFNVVIDGAKHLKNVSKDKPLPASVGLFSTALMASPIFKPFLEPAKNLVGDEASNMIKERFKLNPDVFIDILTRAKQLVIPFVDPSNIDEILSGFLTDNPQYVEFIKNYIGVKGKKLVNDMPKLRKILYDE